MPIETSQHEIYSELVTFKFQNHNSVKDNQNTVYLNQNSVFAGTLIGPLTPRLGRPGSSCSQTVAGGAACRLTRSRRPLGRGPRWPAQPCNSPAVWAPCVQTARRASMLRPAVPGDSPRGSGYIARPWAAFEVATPTPVLRTPTVTHLPTGPHGGQGRCSPGPGQWTGAGPRVPA